MKRLLIALALYSSMTLSGFAVLAYMQIEGLRLQMISGLALLVFAICIFMGIKPANKETEQGFNISICLVAAASLSSLMLYQASINGWLMECILMLIFISLIQILIALPALQWARQKDYVLLFISLQKLMALILVMLAVQDLLSGVHTQFSTASLHVSNLSGLLLP
ncbi:hypothetical protein UNDKW_5631 [Undibacterium sp. KW1]|uniref:hypothetical protein n=1 Tax=Undibacterium sp. KW1 TaxID=2058624 RepID=UPI001331E671|nr:hypothetical protein [Undibacterium sp. KW1]BBB63904.1 hypothetical protein UNDKW_5631 [Undibacterium sp. KW1]